MDSISFCLACCGEVGKKDCWIKQEELSNSGWDLETETDSLNPETLKEELDTERSLSSVPPPLEEEDVILKCFFKIFHVTPPSKKEMSNVDGVLPFCGVCKNQLLKLCRLKQEVEKLENELKVKVRSAEQEFERRNVYQNDRRYFKTRRKVLGDKGRSKNVSIKNPPKKEEGGQAPVAFPEILSTGTKVNFPESSSKSRCSTSRRSSKRISKPVSRFGIGDAASDLLVEISEPVVLDDKYKPEKYDPFLPKVEPLDAASDEDENDFALIDPIYEPSSLASPTHSWLHKEDRGEEEDNSDSWKPSSPPKKNTRTRKISILQADQVRNDSKADRDIVKRPEMDKVKKRGRKPKNPIASEGTLPIPKIKFKKNSFTTVDRKTGTVTIHKVALTLMENGVSYKCSLCSEILPNEKDKMTGHVTKNHSDRNKCHLCDKKLSSPRMLKFHLRVHSGAAPEIITECPICAKPFARRSLLQIHKWSHYSEQERNEAVARGDKLPPEYDKKFQCDQCAKRFSSNTLLKRHLIANHLPEEERPKELCPICGTAVHHLQAHILRVHEEVPDEKKFACTLCSKKFKSNVLLRRHKRVVHLDIREFKCTMCSKRFASNRNLTEHTLFHMNIRKFQCQFCPSGFVKKDHLQRHTKTYHDQGSAPKRRPYTRGLDGKTVQNKSNGNVSQTRHNHRGGGGQGSCRRGASFKVEPQCE